jgi:hypothetical protein
MGGFRPAVARVHNPPGDNATPAVIATISQ